MAPLKESSESGDLTSNPVLLKLQELDDNYLSIKQEFDKKVRALEREYTLRMEPILNERAEVLKGSPSDGVEETSGTPNLPDFWLTVLQTSVEFRDDIEEWDEPVLRYLSNIVSDDIDREDPDKGFYIEFHFAQNPYFTNSTLRKTYHTSQVNTFVDQREVERIESTEIDWNKGKNVTVELVTKVKKRKGGGAKKKNQEKVQTVEKPRDSFFRYFRNIGPDSLEELLAEEEERDDEEDGSEMDPMEKLEMLLEDDWERASGLQCNIIPHALRWYTGEAVPFDGDDDSDEEDEDEFDEDDEDDSDEESDASPVKQKGKKGAKKITEISDDEDESPVKQQRGKAAAGATADAEKPECKQQ